MGEVGDESELVSPPCLGTPSQVMYWLEYDIILNLTNPVGGDVGEEGGEEVEEEGVPPPAEP